jgi:hypothetical protein
LPSLSTDQLFPDTESPLGSRETPRSFSARWMSSGMSSTGWGVGAILPGLPDSGGGVGFALRGGFLLGFDGEGLSVGDGLEETAGAGDLGGEASSSPPGTGSRNAAETPVPARRTSALAATRILAGLKRPMPPRDPDLDPSAAHADSGADDNADVVVAAAAVVVSGGLRR